MRCITKILILRAVWFLFAAPVSADSKKCTVMVYMCGSHMESLHGYASAELQNILFSGVDTDKVNVVVMAGGAKKWHSDLSSEELQIFSIRNTHYVVVSGNTVLSNRNSNIIPQYENEWVGDILNMGEPDTLSTFLKYCEKNYPAEEFALILWSGVGSPKDGIGSDELFQDDFLTLDELDTALKNSSFTGDRKLALITFFSSLMGNVDTAKVCMPYAEYMLADEGTMSTIDYSFLKCLEKDVDIEELSRTFIDHYVVDKTAAENVIPQAASCIDLSVVNDLAAAGDDLIKAIKEKTGSPNPTLVLKGEAFDSPLRVWSSFGLFDLKLLAEKYEEEMPAEAERVKDAIDKAIVYSHGNVEGAAGISVYVS